MAIKIPQTDTRGNWNRPTRQISPDRNFGREIGQSATGIQAPDTASDLFNGSVAMGQAVANMGAATMQYAKQKQALLNADEDAEKQKRARELRIKVAENELEADKKRADGTLTNADYATWLNDRNNEALAHVHSGYEWKTDKGKEFLQTGKDILKFKSLDYQSKELEFMTDKVKANNTETLTDAVNRSGNSVADLEAGKKAIDSVLDSPVYAATSDPTTIESNRIKLKTQAEKNLADTMLNEKPEELILLMKDDSENASIQNLSKADRSNYIQKAKDKIRIENDRRETELVGTYNLAITDIKTKQDVKDLEKAIRADDLSDARKSALLRQLKTSTEKTDKKAENFNTVEQNRSASPGFYTFSTGAKTQTAIDDWWEQKQEIYNAIEDPQTRQLAMQSDVADVGRLPTQVKGQITSGMFSDDPQTVSATAAIVKAFEKDNPNIVQQLDKELLARVEMISRGRTVEQVNTIINKSTSMSKEETKALNETVKTDTEDMENIMSDLVENKFDWTWGDENAAIPTGAQTDYREIYKNNLILTGGDKDAAKTLTEKQWATVWGRSNIDGSDRLMKYAPENVYGIGQESEWMKEQLKRDVKEKFNLEHGTYTLIVNPATVGLSNPTYWIFDKTQGDYARDENNLPAQWRPNHKAYVETIRKERSAAQKKRMEARGK